MRKLMKTNAAKRRFAAVVLATFMLVNIFGAAAEKNPAIVTINCDGNKTTYETYAATVGDFFLNEDIYVKANDYLSHSLTDSITGGMEIVYNIAKYVTVNDNGTTYSSVTYAATVNDVMNDFQAPLKDTDTTSPERETRAYDGLVINVTRNKSVTFINDENSAIYNTNSTTVGEFLGEMGIALQSNQLVEPSENTVIKDGMTIQLYTIKSLNTTYVGESNKNTKKTSSSAPQGAMSKLAFNADLANARVITCEATAYTAAADECGPWADGLTATGAVCQVGVVAVDPNVIPLGTRLYIESVDGSFVYGFCTAEDTGGAIKGNKVDLAMSTKAECFQFGRRQVRVYILD